MSAFDPKGGHCDSIRIGIQFIKQKWRGPEAAPVVMQKQ
jgi:hypothetical protein